MNFTNQQRMSPLRHFLISTITTLRRHPSGSLRWLRP
jgi:hypothetical protein